MINIKTPVINVRIVHTPTIKVKINEINKINVTFKQILIGDKNDFYSQSDIDYIIIPSFQQQTLLTKNKKMANNLIIESIPMTEVSNLSGGITINIGGD